MIIDNYRKTSIKTFWVFSNTVHNTKYPNKMRKKCVSYRLVSHILDVTSEDDLFAHQNRLIARTQWNVNKGASRASDPIAHPQFCQIFGVLRVVPQLLPVLHGRLVAKLSFRIFTNARPTRPTRNSTQLLPSRAWKWKTKQLHTVTKIGFGRKYENHLF